MLDPEQAQKIAFFLGPRGGEYLRTTVARVLKCRETDASRRAVNQDLLLRAQFPQVVQGIVGREQGNGYAGRVFVAPAGGQVRSGARLGDDMGSEARRREAHHRLARFEAVDVAADRHHIAGALHAQVGASETILNRLVGQHPHRQHHVPEIEPRGSGANRDLVFAGHHRPVPAPLEMVEARGRVVQANDIGIPACLSSEAVLAENVERGGRRPHDVTPIRRQNYLVFAIRRSQLADERPGSDHGILGDVQIDQLAAQLRMLVHEHPAKPPERRLGRNLTQEILATATGRHRPTGDEPEPGRDRPVGLQNALNQVHRRRTALLLDTHEIGIRHIVAHAVARELDDLGAALPIGLKGRAEPGDVFALRRDAVLVFGKPLEPVAHLHLHDSMAERQQGLRDSLGQLVRIARDVAHQQEASQFVGLVLLEPGGARRIARDEQIAPSSFRGHGLGDRHDIFQSARGEGLPPRCKRCTVLAPAIVLPFPLGVDAEHEVRQPVAVASPENQQSIGGQQSTDVAEHRGHIVRSICHAGSDQDVERFAWRLLIDNVTAHVEHDDAQIG